MNDILIQSVFFGVMLSLIAYGIGIQLKKKFGLAVFNPLLVAVVVIMGFSLLSTPEFLPTEK